MKEISNRSATYHYAIDQQWIAGMVLQGTEIKALRQGRASFIDSFCLFIKDELWLRGLHIAEYSHGTSNNHVPVRDRKLLLTGRELRKIKTKVHERGYTLIPLRLFISESGYAKVEIGLARGKSTYDKRHTIKDREANRQLNRELQR